CPARSGDSGRKNSCARIEYCRNARTNLPRYFPHNYLLPHQGITNAELTNAELVEGYHGPRCCCNDLSPRVQRYSQVVSLWQQYHLWASALFPSDCCTTAGRAFCVGGSMIDLHCHILPGIDDGASHISVSLAMARAFVADGVTVVAC